MRNATFKSYDHLARALLAIFPDAILHEDADGEIVASLGYTTYGKNGKVRIYTGE